MTLFGQDSVIVECKYVFMCRRAEKLRSAVAVVIGMVKKFRPRMLTSEYKLLLIGTTDKRVRMVVISK